MDKALFSIMDRAMDGLMQTKEFNYLLLNDPYIQEVSDRCSHAMAKLKDLDPILHNEFDEITGNIEAAYTNCGVFYGLQIAEAFRVVALNPLGFSKHVCDRAFGNKEALADVGGDSDPD